MGLGELREREGLWGGGYIISSLPPTPEKPQARSQIPIFHSPPPATVQGKGVNFPPGGGVGLLELERSGKPPHYFFLRGVCCVRGLEMGCFSLDFFLFKKSS